MEASLATDGGRAPDTEAPLATDGARALAVADQLASVAVNGEDADAWDGLRAKLRTRLISDAQRELLDLVLPPSGGVSTTRVAALEECAKQGSIELF